MADGMIQLVVLTVPRRRLQIFGGHSNLLVAFWVTTSLKHAVSASKRGIVLLLVSARAGRITKRVARCLEVCSWDYDVVYELV
ncbi:hypothetical protein RSAG8_13888, partial [Rhizoctonia solani AG-8 WAC10335]